MNRKPYPPLQSSRRAFVRNLGLAPFLLKAAPLFGADFLSQITDARVATERDGYQFEAARYKPHYRMNTDLAAVLKFVEPGSDDYATEKYAFELSAALGRWVRDVKLSVQRVSSIQELLGTPLEMSALTPVHEEVLRSGFGLDATRRQFGDARPATHGEALGALTAWLGSVQKVETFEFEINEIAVTAEKPLTVKIAMRYDLVGGRGTGELEERVGSWRMLCAQPSEGKWEILRWEAGAEILCVGAGGFVDISEHALGENRSYGEQMLRGVDYWRTVLDGACGMDIYANNGVAMGDFDNDGFDDMYVCQPSGLPNRLYRNKGDGTFEDVTEKAGVGLLDSTACALFADLDNRGLQDLIVVCGSGPLLYQNQGDGSFSLKRDAFEFAAEPQGAFTHAAIADYDGDGRLDIYFCTYMYYLGLDQYHYPAPYYDARNGPPNVLMHNEGGGRFVERTVAAGLNVENNRYSFACAWGDANGNGHPDLCLANDFGTSQLYRNNGDGTFTMASGESHVDDVGAGMSACWCDFNNDGHQDIYTTSMWEAAGQRVSEQTQFHPKASAEIREKYRRHARGNALYRNAGDGTFENVAQETGTAMGRWSWSADFWDVDHDGFPDLYVTNGYVSAIDKLDLASFFWRQVVAKSPEDNTALQGYERGWNAINELIRSDHSWNAPERNVMFANNRDGTFSEVSGVLGLDCLEDSRSFALADIDHDGRLEVILKNRNAPQVRILRNEMSGLGHSISFRLRGRTSNRDAIGASITLEAGESRQTRYLQAGSGFLSQHSKEVFFGVGKVKTTVKATVRWPNGSVQQFPALPVNHRIELEEGLDTFVAKNFESTTNARTAHTIQPRAEVLPNAVETWLISPLRAPVFALPDAKGKTFALKDTLGSPVLLHLWSAGSAGCREQLLDFERSAAAFAGARVSVVTMNLDGANHSQEARQLLQDARTSFPSVIATDDIAGIYNIIFRYLFDRRRDLELPTSFLLDPEGMIVKVYQGTVSSKRVLSDIQQIPQNARERLAVALPFPGVLVQGAFQRNDFTYGVALFQHGYFDEAAASFEQVVAARPNDAEAYYNLGTLDLRRNNFAQAKRYLEKTLSLRADYPEAWNNLGMIAGQEGDADTAIESFKKALALRPEYEIALLNLGNVYRRQRNYGKADETLNRAFALQPDDPEVNYSLGMLHAQQGQMEAAVDYLQKAIALKADYAEAINNLGIVFVRTQQMDRAEQMFKEGIQAAPYNDQAYLNLARLYVMQNNREGAREVLQQLLRLQPQNATASQALEGLR
jgi:tetratricopeptide (TPR) repeat protein/peroxiredoxin